MKIPFFKSEIIRRGSLVFIAAFLASLIALFANIFISDLLEPAYFGVFKTIVYLFAFLPMIVDFGINATLTKYVAEFGKDCKKTGCLVRWLLKIKLMSYIFLILAIFLLKDCIALYFLKDASLSYLVTAGIVLLSFNFFLSFSFIVLGFQNFKLYSFSQFLSSALSPVLALLLSPLGIFYMILGWSLGPLIGNLPNISFLIKKKIFSDYEKIDVKKIFFKFSLPIFPVEFSTSLFTVIVPLLSLFFSQKLIGYYSFAYMFYYAAILIPNSISIVLFPKIAELNGLKRYGHAKDILKRSFLYYSLIAVSGLVLVFLLSEWFINTLSSDYLPSLFMFKIIASLGFVFGYNSIYTNYLKGLGKVKRYALFTLTQNIFLMAISFVLLNSMI